MYGISLATYDALVSKQNGLCALCGQPERSVHPKSGTPFELSVDHDRRCCPGKKSCGKCVRGLLCNRCNRTIGGFRDDPLLLAAALTYLRGWLHIVRPVSFVSLEEPSGPVKKEMLESGEVERLPVLTTIANALGEPPTLMEAPTPEMLAP